MVKDYIKPYQRIYDDEGVYDSINDNHVYRINRKHSFFRRIVCFIIYRYRKIFNKQKELIWVILY